MRRFALAGIALAMCGCSSFSPPPPPPAPEPPKPQHALVRIEGVDGTIFRGELLNGSVTVDCGQGELTLLTDHITSINFSSSGDVVDSASLKLTGKIVEKIFLLQSEHGVFTLQKERLKKIDFAPTGSTTPPPATTPAARSGTSKTGRID